MEVIHSLAFLVVLSCFSAFAAGWSGFASLSLKDWRGFLMVISLFNVMFCVLNVMRIISLFGGPK